MCTPNGCDHVCSTCSELQHSVCKYWLNVGRYVQITIDEVLADE